MKRRLLLKLGLFVLLGAIVNVAVAWGCAMYSAQRCQLVRAEVDDSWWRGRFPSNNRGEPNPLVRHRRVAAGIGVRVHVASPDSEPYGRANRRQIPLKSTDHLAMRDSG